MSERGRVALIFGAVAVAAAGGGYYFLKIYRPAQVEHDAQDQVSAWELRWKAARECLLGPSPASSKTSEALAIREMTPDPWERGKCTPLVSKLSRGEAPDTGIDQVEAAWAELDRAAAKAATAFATHVASSTTRVDDPLPAALDQLDAARDQLRAAAHLPLEQRAGSPLTAAQVLPITDGAERVESLDVDALLPSAHGMILYGKTASRLVQVDLVVGAKPQVARVGPGTMRAIPDASWGARPGAGEIQIGAFDVEGAMPPGENGSGAARLKLDGDVGVTAVIGTPAEGEVVYGTVGSHGSYGQLVVAHAHEASITAEAPERTIDWTTASDADGRAVVVWTDTNKVKHARIVRPSGDEPATKLPLATIGEMCLTADRAWTLAVPENRPHDPNQMLVGFAGGKPPTMLPLEAPLVGCTAEAAVMRRDGSPPTFFLCSDTCRPAELPQGAPDMSVTTVVGGKLVAMVAHGGVLAMWREGAKPVFYAVPAQLRPVFARGWPTMAFSDGKVIDILAQAAGSFVIVRVPAAT